MKTCKVLLLGYGVAGKAFARILNKTHESIAAEKGQSPGEQGSCSGASSHEVWGLRPPGSGRGGT